MTFRQNISRFVTGELGLGSLPGIALAALEHEFDTPSLRILAGLSENENEFVIDQYFKDTLKELSIDLPDKRKAAIEVAVAIAEEIFEGKQEVFEGVQNMISKAIDAYPFYEEDVRYSHDSIGFEKVYGLFDSIDDLRYAGSQWQIGKTNQELLAELTQELLAALTVWTQRMKQELTPA